jgi:NAD(P)-dependent dehydrogenase (short-subunit alcohol dehydrogenase family)
VPLPPWTRKKAQMNEIADEAGATERRPSGPLDGSRVVVLGGSAGIGLAVAGRASREGAAVIVTGRDPGRLEEAGRQVGAERTAAFDLSDHDARSAFFDGLNGPVDHVFVSGSGPYYAPLAEIDLARAGEWASGQVELMIDLARLCAPVVRPGGSLSFMSGTGARRPAVGTTVIAAVVGAATAVARNLALEIAPLRINLLAAGFVDTPLSSRLLGSDIDARRAELARDLPIRRVVTADDVAFLAVHIMENTALTGAVFDIDGGQQLLS